MRAWRKTCLVSGLFSFFFYAFADGTRLHNSECNGDADYNFKRYVTGEVIPDFDHDAQ